MTFADRSTCGENYLELSHDIDVSVKKIHSIVAEGLEFKGMTFVKTARMKVDDVKFVCLIDASDPRV